MSVLDSKITRDQAEIVAQIIENGGELTAELEREVELIDLNRAQEVDSLHMTLELMGHYKTFWEAKELEAAKIRRSLEKLHERYRYFIKSVMIASGTEELHGNEYRYKLSKLSPKVVIEELAEQALIETYGKEVTKVVLDKDRLKEDLEAGVPVEGAKMQDVHSLRSYPQKKRLAV
jgi:predicted kinase